MYGFEVRSQWPNIAIIIIDFDDCQYKNAGN